MSIKFAAIGLSHNHIYNQVECLLAEGAELRAFYSAEAEAEIFAKHYPQAKRQSSIDAILEDREIQMVVSAVIPNERAALGIRVMQAGKDYSCAKPAFTNLEQLSQARQVQAATGRIFTVHFGEHYGNAATVKAELVRAGQIGQVIQTTGFGPHRLFGHNERPAWFFDKQYFAGILNDLASHQIEQFLYFTGSTKAEIVSAHCSNHHHPQFPLFEDYGEILIRSEQARGFIRVDWLSPKGLETWGDVRLFLLGTEGSIEIRKNIDIKGKAGKDHLFLVNADGSDYIHCENLPLPYGKQLIADVLNRSESAMSQNHCFLACELALKSQNLASMNV